MAPFSEVGGNDTAFASVVGLWRLVREKKGGILVRGCGKREHTWVVSMETVDSGGGDEMAMAPRMSRGWE